MANKVKVKRGLKERLPLLDNGELAFVTDTKEFYVGDGIENQSYLNKSLIKNDLNGGIENVLSAEQGKILKDLLIEKNSFLDELKLRFVYGILGDGTDETLKFEKALNENDTIYIPKGYVIGLNKTLEVAKPIKIYSSGSTLKALTNGMDRLISVTNATNVEISGIKFDSNMIGRSCVEINNSNNVSINNCEFTGYSGQYAYYKTDSAIRVNKSQYVFIEKNYIHDFGNQYGANLETLNRAITINDAFCKDIFIRNNIINEVNQCFILIGERIIVDGNIVTGVHDNTIYALAVKDLTVVNNIFYNKYDENIVINGINILIANNKLYESPNKAIAINGSSTNLQIINNDFRNETVTTGQFIVYRDYTSTVDGLIIKDNNFYQKYETQYSYFILGNVNNLCFENNIIDVVASSGKKIITFNGVTSNNGSIKYNTITGTASDSIAFSTESGVSSASLEYENNDLRNCRFNPGVANVKFQKAQLNVGPYINGNVKNRIIFSTQLPSVGSWTQGDTVYNITPSPGGYVGWICTTGGTPGTWKGFGLIQS